MSFVLELKDVIMIGGVVVSIAYSIFKIEGQAKKNELVLKNLEEKHNIFLDHIQSDLKQDIENLEKRMELKKTKIEELEKLIKDHNQEFNKYLLETTKTFEKMLDKATADKTYVTKSELNFKLNSIENKLDLLVELFKDGATCEAKRKVMTKETK